MKKNSIHKILIANRGEITSRILRAARKLDIECAVVYTADDTGHSYLHDRTEKYLLEGDSIRETFLNQSQLIRLAISAGADAIHPGYGFLSEDPSFALNCIDHGLTWIGPSPEAMKTMASKANSRQAAIEHGVPVLQAWAGSRDELVHQAHSFTYPVLIKALAGGGGRGMRIIRNEQEFIHQADSAIRESELFFGNPMIFVEQYVEPARHIEVQILGDHYGKVIHLFDRECSIQRRYQKIIEEAPSPSLNEAQRTEILDLAVKLARSTGYNNAGTAEFLMGPDGQFYFIEMNARIQVEHPVTEMITGIDLVAEQIRIAMGEPISFSQSDIKIKGHAIECRIVAEDPTNDFIPSPGTLNLFSYPQQTGIRIEESIIQGAEVSTHYDPMIAKVIAYAPDRMQSIGRLRKALTNLVIQGVRTNREFQLAMLSDPDYISNQLHTHFIRENSHRWVSKIARIKNDQTHLNKTAVGFLLGSLLPMNNVSQGIWKKTGHWRAFRQTEIQVDKTIIRMEYRWLSDAALEINIGNQTYFASAMARDKSRIQVKLDETELSFYLTKTDQQTGMITYDGWDHVIDLAPAFRPLGDLLKADEALGRKNGSGKIVAPLPGKIMKLLVQSGSLVKKGESMLIIESMKTENQVLATQDYLVTEILVRVGQDVKLNESLIKTETN